MKEKRNLLLFAQEKFDFSSDRHSFKNNRKKTNEYMIDILFSTLISNKSCKK